jgi:S-adenosylmethionine hydrolase
MRAVVAGICPEAVVVDLAHDVDKFAIRDGALLLWSAVPYLPIGAHVAVGCGVGTERKGIAVQAAAATSRGPRQRPAHAGRHDGGITRAHLLEDPRYSLPDVSSSFQPRRLRARPQPRRRRAHRELGRAVDPRRLLGLGGRGQTSVRGASARRRSHRHLRQREALGTGRGRGRGAPELRLGELLDVRIIGDGASCGLQATWARAFGDVAQGVPLLTVDSYGRASLAVHLGSAAGTYGVTLDGLVEVSRAARR